ncbi:hypothetical protein PF008_g17599 [Phytophthora fragariae]|uniref:RING-type domain-containing protein n=1 Tax=Phytophthora fragariae TaxID=53985 RepID=A0A6G0R7T0_9STRA|nr:hypothetical protein PF008_g17599 [Phytophthora fragariae]
MSRKSITSATVVPTARDDQHDNLSTSTLDRNVAASEEDVVATTSEHLIHAEAEETPQATDDSQGTNAEASNPHDTDEPPKDEQSFPPKPFPLPISHGMPHNVELTDRGGFKFVNNNKALATSFKHLQPFARCPDGTYSAEVSCLLCGQVKPTSVFFPCQHMSVCNNCIRVNDMSPECSMNLERCVCPACSADIDLILPHTGSEEDA